MVKKIVIFILIIGVIIIGRLGYYLYRFDFLVVHKKGMKPTYDKGDVLICDKKTNKISDLEHKDVIIIKLDENFGFSSEIMIKRVIGLPGDKILIKDGSVFVNGELLQENYIIGEQTKNPKDQFSDIEVSKGMIYVLADNRTIEVVDSRSIGLINENNIMGKVTEKAPKWIQSILGESNK